VRDVEKVLRRQRSKTFSQVGAAPEEILQGRRASRPTTPSFFSIHTKTTASITPSSATLKDRIGLFETLSCRKLIPEAPLWHQGTSLDEATELSDASIPSAESKRCGRLRGTLRRVSASLRPRRERKIVDAGAHIVSSGQVRATDGTLPINRTASQTKNSLDSITWSIGLSEYVTSNESKKASVASLPCNPTLHLLTGKGLSPRSGYLAGQHISMGSGDDACDRTQKRGKSRLLCLPASHTKSETDVLFGKESKTHVSGRRHLSRSSTPVVAKVQCTLKEPRPLRVGEMRRIISLCRGAMSGRGARSYSD
jgi:hypothetical protein